ncbi:MAG TPA: cytochrome b/b6 domain-containing protein, partial [Acetobacteraceae bacterium]|nr:cytochrome b/b6 domain-containing protein [Acetobacteraceae bacterium]
MIRHLVSCLTLLVALTAPVAAQPTSPAQAATEAGQEQQQRQDEQPAQTPGVPAGAPEVQGAAPEVGAGRGGPNAAQPTTSEPQPPTGAPRPAAPASAAPQAPTPVAPIPPGAPFAARDRFDAAELELQHALRGGVIAGAVSIPNQSAGILIQPAGRDWRQFRNEVLTIAGIVAVIGMIVALALFYMLRGTTRLEAGRSGQTIRRYSLFERANHWMVAFSFVLLALTGLNITYGVYVLRPLIGPEAFTTLTYWGQAIHHFIAFAFMLGVLVMLVLWARQNIPNRVDVAWLRAGGPLAKGHPPAGKFNGAQKALYWLSMLGGIAVSVSGILLMAPYLLDNVILQQWAHIAHGLIAIGMIALILGHAYIGSIGQE